MKTWDEMTARERDALVATEVMGLELRGWARCYVDPTNVTVIEVDEDGHWGERTAVYLARGESREFYLDHLDEHRDTELYKDLRQRFDAELEAWGTDRLALDPVPHYSTDIGYAWEVVENLREEGWLVRVQEKPDEVGWDEADAMPRAYCSLSWMRRETTEGARKAIHEHPRGMADTAPEAICKAALATRGIDA